jgi:hypothetical protein
MIRDDTGRYVLGCTCELIAMVRADEQLRIERQVHYGEETP